MSEKRTNVAQLGVATAVIAIGLLHATHEIDVTARDKASSSREAEIQISVSAGVEVSRSADERDDRAWANGRTCWKREPRGWRTAPFG